MQHLRVPPLIKACSAMIIALWLLVTAFYHLGADGVSLEDSYLSFEREYDHQLFKISKGYALQVSAHEESEPTIVQYDSCLFPLSWLCGRYETQRTLLPGPLFVKEQLIVSARIGPEGHFAVDTETNTTYRAPVDMGEDSSSLHSIPEFQLISLYHQIGFDPQVDAQEPVTYEMASAGSMWPELSVSQEGCLVFNMAFIALLLIIVILILLLSIQSMLKARSTQVDPNVGGD